jgi:hypothetical protein
MYVGHTILTLISTVLTLLTPYRLWVIRQTFNEVPGCYAMLFRSQTWRIFFQGIFRILRTRAALTIPVLALSIFPELRNYSLKP